jgi:hypothetical protein
MRKYRSVVMAAACAAALAVPASAAYAAGAPGLASAKHHVLTTGKAGGPAVAPKAVLSASVAKGTTVKFTFLTFTLKCSSSTVTGKVTSNPAAPGTAKESVTGETIGNCTINFKALSIKSIKAENLPWTATVSDKKGDPVTVTGSSKSKPIKLVVKAVLSGTTNFECIYASKGLVGTASNKDNGFSFSKQVFTSQKGSFKDCPATSDGTATYAPLRDLSVTGHPKVFVN